MKVALVFGLLPLLCNASPIKRDNVTSSPFSPSGGINVSLSNVPTYDGTQTEFDFQSFNLALNQEWIELDLFHYALATFADEEFEQYGINAQDRYLIQRFADQETGHARLLSDILRGKGAKSCSYKYPFTDVSGFIAFTQQLTRWGESGVYGFLGHLNDQSAASLLVSSIATEARQQYTFRQLEGLMPADSYFVAGIPQSWGWSLVAPYIVACPADNIKFQLFPSLNVSSNQNVSNAARGVSASIGGTNLTELNVKPGQTITLSWDGPGKVAAYNRSQSLYYTNTTASTPAYAAWVSHLNLTYTKLENITSAKDGSGSAITFWPDFINLFPNSTTEINVDQNVLSGTLFVAVTDSNTHFSPYNLSGINAHVVAGPAMFQAELI